jgi:hypothetical protein
MSYPPYRPRTRVVRRRPLPAKWLPYLAALMIAVTLLAGCGLAETGAVAGANAASAVEQTKQAEQQLQRVQQQLDQAQAQAAAARAATETATQ